jgi:hypothetical protein
MKAKHVFWIALPLLAAALWTAQPPVQAQSPVPEAVVVKVAEAGATRGFLGVVPQRIDHVLRAALGFEDPGVLLAEVVPESPAALAGLQVGDILLSVKGLPVHDPDRLRSLLKDCRPGEEVALQIQRQGKKRSLKATLGERPAPKVHWHGDLQGLEGLRDLEALRGLEGLRGLEALSALEGLKVLGEVDWTAQLDSGSIADLEELELDLQEMEIDLQEMGRELEEYFGGSGPATVAPKIY